MAWGPPGSCTIARVRYRRPWRWSQDGLGLPGSCTIARVRYRRPWRWVPRWLGATGVGADQGKGCIPNEGGGAPLCSAEMRRAGTRTRFDGEFWLRKRSRRPWRCVPRWLGATGAVADRGGGALPTKGGARPCAVLRCGVRERALDSTANFGCVGEAGGPRGVSQDGLGPPGPWPIGEGVRSQRRGGCAPVQC